LSAVNVNFAPGFSRSDVGVYCLGAACAKMRFLNWKIINEETDGDDQLHLLWK
jgi:hypothetical protein